MPIEIVTAESFYGQMADSAHPLTGERRVPADHPARLHPHLLCQAVQAPDRPPGGKTGEPVLAPFVDAGRWVVRCPFCPSAQAASVTDPWFYCVECFNADAGQKSVPVGWPDEADEIDRLLSLRPTGFIANWQPTESVAQLRLENAHLGLGDA